MAAEVIDLHGEPVSDVGEVSPVVSQQAWTILANEMRGLDTRVAQAHIIGAPSDPWQLPPIDGSPASHAAQAAYLDRVASRLQEIANAVKKAANAPEEKTRELGNEVGLLARDAANHGWQIAKKIGAAAEKSLKDLESSLETGAVGLGIGFGFALLAALLVLARSTGH